MNRRLGIAIILNVLNILDLVLTLIATQMSHIDFINTEGNAIFVSAYSELLAGSSHPLFLLLLIKLIAPFLFAILLISVERHPVIAIVFGIIFSLYSVSNILWILVIVKAPFPSQLMIDMSIILLFVLSFFIYYSPSELKNFVWDIYLLGWFTCYCMVQLIIQYRTKFKKDQKSLSRSDVLKR